MGDQGSKCSLAIIVPFDLRMESSVVIVVHARILSESLTLEGDEAVCSSHWRIMFLHKSLQHLFLPGFL